MTEDLTPSCRRCRHWAKLPDRDHGNCGARDEGRNIHYTMPDDFCKSFTPPDEESGSE